MEKILKIHEETSKKRIVYKRLKNLKIHFIIDFIILVVSGFLLQYFLGDEHFVLPIFTMLIFFIITLFKFNYFVNTEFRNNRNITWRLFLDPFNSSELNSIAKNNLISALKSEGLLKIEILDKIISDLHRKNKKPKQFKLSFSIGFLLLIIGQLLNLGIREMIAIFGFKVIILSVITLAQMFIVVEMFVIMISTRKYYKIEEAINRLKEIKFDLEMEEHGIPLETTQPLHFH